MSNNLSDAPETVFRLWCHRLKIELEAAQIFSNLAKDLYRLYGPTDPIGKLCEEAMQDELRHAVLCKEILSYSPIPFAEPKLPEQIQLGPQNRSLHDKILYACVAVGCVTETLSTALLIEMRNRAAPGIVHNTVHEILVDEISHSRIGWGELSRASKHRDTSWLSQDLKWMLDEALQTEIKPMLSFAEGQRDLSAWGILPPEESNAVVQKTIAEVVLPGLANFGVQF
jgi:hypothetical protein